MSAELDENAGPAVIDRRYSTGFQQPAGGRL